MLASLQCDAEAIAVLRRALERCFHRSKISRSKIYVSAANRRTFAGPGRYRRARSRSAESFSSQ